MCMDVRKTCECGANSVQFHLRDNVMKPEVISRLFCPSCQGDVAFDHDTMFYDNGWVIEYDMDLARMLLIAKQRAEADHAGPQALFDSGYACWQEMYPGEREDMRQEKEEIMALLETDLAGYLKKIQSWNVDRVARLKEEGWRKAQFT